MLKEAVPLPPLQEDVQLAQPLMSSIWL